MSVYIYNALTDAIVYTIRTNSVNIIMAILTTVPTSRYGKNNDVLGMIAVDSTHFYYTTGNYTGANGIWYKVAKNTLTPIPLPPAPPPPPLPPAPKPPYIKPPTPPRPPPRERRKDDPKGGYK